MYIVAEIGINHNGNINDAKRLIRVAKLSGADAVKFQMFHHFSHLKPYEFTKNQWIELFAYCRENKIEHFTTAFDKKAVDFLDRQGQTIWKIPSNPHVTDDPHLLEKIAKSKNRKLTIISTGILDYQDIQRLLGFFDNRKVVLLHCVSKYPCPVKELNLSRIKQLIKKFKVPVGFSDHSISVTAPVVAAQYGAEIIEKHITLDRNQAGPDHKASLEPHEFKIMVEHLR